MDEIVGARSRLAATEGEPKFAIRLILNEQIPTTIKTTGLNIDNKRRLPVRELPAHRSRIPITVMH